MLFELVDEQGQPVHDLIGATATARLRRVDTLPDDAELVGVLVRLDAAAGSATLELSGIQTGMIGPPPGELYGEISGVVKVLTGSTPMGVDFYGPFERTISNPA